MSLKSPPKNCTLCTLSETCTFPLEGQGKREVKFMLVDYIPTAEEDRESFHFVSDSGILLEAMLNSVGLSRRDFYVTKVLKCKSEYKSVINPNDIKACTENYLHSEIDTIQPKAILAMGSEAGQYFVNGKFRITVDRGWYKWKDYNVFITYHPRYLLRFPSLESNSPKWQCWNDLKEFSKQNYLPF